MICRIRNLIYPSKMSPSEKKTKSDTGSDHTSSSHFETFDQILHWHLKEGLWYNPDLISDLFSAFPLSADNQALLINATNNAAINLECMECILSKLTPAQKAIGIVTGHNLANSLLVGVYLNMFSPRIPVKVFKTRELAQIWLEEQISEK